MNKVRILDETLRNGQQSLWATRMRTESMLPIAPVMDEAGFDTVGVMAGVSFESAAMYLFEDPWERIRLLCQHMPRTSLDVLVVVPGIRRKPSRMRRQKNDGERPFMAALLFKLLKNIEIPVLA